MSGSLDFFNSRAENISQLLIKDLESVRAGRATPALVENILVDYWGIKTPIKQLASMTSPEPKMLIIQPWHKETLPLIEKAIIASNIGISPAIDGNVIRLVIPPLTQERREDLLRILNRKLEEARIQLRQARDEALKRIGQDYGSKVISEDDRFRVKRELGESVDEATSRLNEIATKKEKEIKEL